MKEKDVQTRIESLFRNQVQKDERVKNAYLLVDSDKLNIHLNAAAGTTDGSKAHIGQPNHLASVGKLFTAALIGILHERRQLDYDDPVVRYLDADLMKGLHIYRGKDYSDQITIGQLLMQTSGLNDVFYHLWKKKIADPDFRTTPRDAIIWGKNNLEPKAVPGRRHFYTDTNYYLLGLIIESITKKGFHEVMHDQIFNPLGMRHAWLHGLSKPEIESEYPTARLYIKGCDLLSISNIHEIDYAGGSVIAPLTDFLTFMRALVNHRIVKKETLDKMIGDDVSMGFPSLAFNYGYSVWKTRTIPLILPRKYYCWGCVGVTGAFMFHHPGTESFIIGSFNDFSWRGKALDFMAGKVIKELLHHQEKKGIRTLSM